MMGTSKFLFISRKSSHYKYYKTVVAHLQSEGKQAELKSIKKFVFPRFEFLHQAASLNSEELIGTHIKRKLCRYPKIANWPKFVSLISNFYLFRERIRASYYFGYFQKQKATTLVVWNGMKQPNRTPYLVAKTMGLQTYLFENGLLPNTTTLDPQGVNALNSLPKDPLSYLQYYEHKKQCEALEHSNKTARPTLDVRKAKNKQAKETSNSILPQHFIFVPFQVPSDTQIICHSPWIKDMDALYEKVEEAITFARQKTDIDLKVVIKEHPSCSKNYEHLYDRCEHILFINHELTQTLIERSLAVTTINSTVGLESILLEKPVITLGNACININGLCSHCNTQDALNQAFQKCNELDTSQANSELRNAFISYLEDQYAIPYSWSKLKQLSAQQQKQHFTAISERLSDTAPPLQRVQSSLSKPKNNNAHVSMNLS